MRQYREKEEALSSAKEKVAEAEEILEEFLPSTAEELGWIRENLVGEILVARRESAESRGEFSSRRSGFGFDR